MSAGLDAAAHLRRLYEERGGATYSEDVTMLQHGLQTAALARQAEASAGLVAAALLHDVGHFLQPPDDACGYHAHAEAGAEYLGRWFNAEVCEPVRLHVAAKRWLCAKEPDYAAGLSPASAHSLHKQGGIMNGRETATFEAERYFAEAIALRRWDDHGKQAGLQVAPFAAYEALLRRLARG